MNHAICKMFMNAGLNPAYGLGLPCKTAEVGFRILQTKATMHLCQGGAPIAKVMAESASALRNEYTATGIATHQDIDRYMDHALDPHQWSVFYSTVSIVGRAEWNDRLFDVCTLRMTIG